MKLSIFTTITKPKDRGENYIDSLKCYGELADEVIIVNGGPKESIVFADPFYLVENYWAKEFDWPFIGEQFQRGYEACTGDWVIHADLDFLFHERDFEAIRKACEATDAPALSFWKYQFILPDRYNLKSRLVIAVNKGKYGDRIRFDSGGDLCQPSLDGKLISPDDIPEARVPFYCYEKLAKSEAQIKDDVGRMDRAYHRHFGEWLYSQDGSDDSAYEGWWRMSQGRFNKPQEKISIEAHPKYIQETIKNLRPDQFGHSGFGRLKGGYFI